MGKIRKPPGRAIREKETAMWIDCVNYVLQIRNSDDSFVFDLRVWDKAGKTYSLQVMSLHDRVSLVQKTLRTMADRWPSYALQIQTDANTIITDVQ